MTHPSDETFLDEMAQAAALAKDALDFVRSYTDDEWLDAVEGLKASATPEAVLRLVALARRAPALTWQTDDMTILRHIEEWRKQSDLRRLASVGLLVTIDQILRDRLGIPHNAPLPAPPEARP